MVPPLLVPAISRPDHADRLLEVLTVPDEDLLGMTSAVEGTGGFGKTTLVQMVCSLPQVRQRFPGGVLWTAVGENTAGPDLAERVNQLCEVLSLRRPTTSDPVVAGIRLGELLDTREATLLIVDDVWTRTQLDPFLRGGQQCHRLVTTRNRGVVPRECTPLLVDQMSRDQATEILIANVDDLPDAKIAQLLSLTGCWPVLLSLVNRALVEYVREEGAGPAQAATWLISRLEANGPTAVDINDAESRSAAVAATMTASLDLLTEDERDRYVDLAIFPDDVNINMLSMLWETRGEFNLSKVHALRDKLLRLRLASGVWDDQHPLLRLHDVIRSYLRHRSGTTAQVATHNAFIDAARQQFGMHTETNGLPTWWTLPDDAGYLWRQLVFHLAEAGLDDQAATLVCDLRWVEKKIRVLESTLPVEADCALVSRRLAVDGKSTAARLGHALRQSAHLLAPINRSPALGATLASRLDNVAGLETLTDQYRTCLPTPRLDPAWPLPDRADPRQRCTFATHNGGVNGAAYSPDGTLLASAGDDGTVQIRDVATRDLRATFTSRTGAVSGVSFSPDGAVLATSGDGTVRIWDVADETTRTTLTDHTGWVNDVAFSPDGALLASAGNDRTVRIWKVNAAAPHATPFNHNSAVCGMVFSADGTLLASACDDGTVWIWDVAHGTARTMLTDHTGTVNGVAFSPDGALLASAGNDDTVRVWDVETGTPRITLVGHSDWVYGVAFSPDGVFLASAGGDGAVKIWDVARGTIRTTLTGHTDWVYDVVFAPKPPKTSLSDPAPTDIMLASVSNDGTVRIWDFTTALTHTMAAIQADGIHEVAFSPDGRLLASAGSSDQTVQIWEVDTGTKLTALRGHAGRVSGIAFSPDGALLASVRSDEPVRIWDVLTGDLQSIFTGHTGMLTNLAFSPDGALLASAGNDGLVRIWEVKSGTIQATPSSHIGVTAVAFSPDGLQLASAGGDETVRLWDVASGAARAILTGHAGWVHDVAFSPDGTLLASASSDAKIKIWDVATSGLLTSLLGHTGTVKGLAFSSDGSLLSSVGENDHSIRVWDVADGTCTAALRVAAPLFGCAWHPHKQAIALAGAAGTYLLNYQS
nr:NB-ARC domain-containing protein [Frankia sp. Cr1]